MNKIFFVVFILLHSNILLADDNYKQLVYFGITKANCDTIHAVWNNIDLTGISVFLKECNPNSDFLRISVGGKNIDQAVLNIKSSILLNLTKSVDQEITIAKDVRVTTKDDLR